MKNINYNAKAQRTEIEYGNDVTTEYSYDPETFRLIRILTTRKGTQIPKELQDLKYTYDPVGNITEIRDDAHRSIFHNNQAIDPLNRYTYDALYRLIESTGREHEAMGACHYQTQDKKQTEFLGLPQAINNAQALITYTETYRYDKSGNIEEIKHNNRHNGWTRSQTYENGSNRIQRSQAGCQHENNSIAHDANGNMLSLPHLPGMAWNFKNQLIEVQLNEGTNPNNAYYQYDSDGQRVRKTIVKNGKTEERIYLGGYEIYTKRNGSGMTLRRDTIHVMDDKDRIALIEEEKEPVNGQTLTSRIRYQLSNHLGSATLEVVGALDNPRPYDPDDWQYRMDSTRLDVGEGPKKYQGAPLGQVLEGMGLQPGASTVVVDRAGDPISIPLEVVLRDDKVRVFTIVGEDEVSFAVARMDGEVLASDATGIEVR